MRHSNEVVGQAFMPIEQIIEAASTYPSKSVVGLHATVLSAVFAQRMSALRLVTLIVSPPNATARVCVAIGWRGVSILMFEFGRVHAAKLTNLTCRYCAYRSVTDVDGKTVGILHAGLDYTPLHVSTACLLRRACTLWTCSACAGQGLRGLRL
jgi:hypothetical protein